MANLQIGELVALLLKSPRGIIALVAMVGSILAFVYLFLIKSASSKRSSSSSSRRATSSKKQSSSGRSTPAKSTPSKRSPVKKSASGTKNSSPNTTKQTKASSNSKQQSAASKDEPATSTSTKKEGKGNKVSRASPVGDSVFRETRNVARQASAQEDGEWITVSAKKKPRSSSGKNKSGDEAAPAPTSKPRIRSR